MLLTFLGTASGAPSRQRNVSGLAITETGGDALLIDCGEGTQHQLQKSRIRIGRIGRVLITHLHGDHCFGLPGLLSTLGMQARERPVEVVGPRGIQELVSTSLSLSQTSLPFRLSFVQLEGAAELRAKDGLLISAYPIAHRVPCFGYVLREPPRRGRLSPEKADQLGVPEGPLRGQLAGGSPVTLPSGRVVAPHEVLGPPRRGLHVVVLGDTYDASAIADAAAGCDLLVHEATFDSSLEEKAREWGHSTAQSAGRFAARIGARTLVVTHFSGRYDSAAAIEKLRNEAQAAAGGTRVLAAHDLMELQLKPPP